MIWNLAADETTFGSNVTLTGTLLSWPTPDTGTIAFGAGSSINGAVLTVGQIIATGAMHLNFWPFTAAP